MRIVCRYMVVLLLMLSIFLSASGQSTSVDDRTPEQEAALQTEKLQKELDLTAEQAKNIYEINLKYAYERRQSNKRTDAVTRIKKKNEEISRVLNDKQHSELQSRKRTIQTSDPNNERYNLRTDSKSRVEDNETRTNTSGVQNANRPFRPDFRPSIRPTGTEGRNSQSTASTPVRRNGYPAARTQPGVSQERRSASSAENSRAAAPPQGRTSSGTVERSTPSRTEQSHSSTPVRNEGRSTQSQSSGRESNTNSRR